MSIACTLLIWMACERSPAPVAVQSSGIDDGAAAVQAGLSEAARRLAAGDRAAAAATVRDTYRAWFEPMEDALRAADPQSTFELEYAFGIVAFEIGEEGDPSAAAADLQDLQAGVEALAARAAELATPAAAPAPAAPAPAAPAPAPVAPAPAPAAPAPAGSGADKAPPDTPAPGR